MSKTTEPKHSSRGNFELFLDLLLGEKMKVKINFLYHNCTPLDSVKDR